MRVLIGLVIALGLASAAPAATTVTIAADQSGPTIERDIFGQFAEHLGTGIYGGIWVGRGSPIPNVRGIRSDVVAALRAIHVPNVRWPGGCYGDDYHWRQGIGPQGSRPVTLNSNWGGVTEPNSFGTAEYMDFLNQIGADAYVSVNLGSGTPQESAEWLEYMTSSQPTTLARLRGTNGHASPYTVKYLGLGNENWGCGGAMSADHYVEEMKRFAHWSRNYNPAQEGDHAMKRIAVGWDAGANDYTEAVMKAWASHVYSWDIDGVSLHSYTVAGGWPPHVPSYGFGAHDYAAVLHETLNMDALIGKQTAIMDHYDPKKKLMLAVDEWGTWYSPNPGSNPGFLQQQNSLRDGLVAALNLDIFIRHADRVRLANIAQMINVLQAMILTDGAKMVLTPTYHVYRMYVPFQGATALPVTFDAGSVTVDGISLPRLDAVAARSAEGKLWLSVVNLDPDHPATISPRIAGVRLAGATGEVLTADKVDALDSFATPKGVVPAPVHATSDGGALSLTVPAKSVTVVELTMR